METPDVWNIKAKKLNNMVYLRVWRLAIVAKMILSFQLPNLKLGLQIADIYKLTENSGLYSCFPSYPSYST